MPRITIVIPVFNRPAELRRALSSVVAQTFGDFECLVVDDCSPAPVEPVVAGFGDPRLRYLRNERNGGPYNARTVGYRHMTGEFLLQLDSDWEAYPWALDRAVHYLDAHPEADAVAGMHVRQSDLAMFVRVRDHQQLVTPQDYVKGRLGPDCVGAVRRCVVDEWLAKRTDYFAMEFHQWFTFSLHRSQLYVDEPWTRYHVAGADRVSGSRNERFLDDYMKFIEEHDVYLRTVEAPFLSDVLFQMWLELLRSGRSAERRRVEFYLRLRNVPLRRRLAGRVVAKLLSTLGRKSRAPGERFTI